MGLPYEGSCFPRPRITTRKRRVVEARDVKAQDMLRWGSMVAIAALTLSLALAALFVSPARGLEGKDGTSRAIAIAYDNSGSMIRNNVGGSWVSTDRWCSAWYSLEVIAAMMDGDDVLSVYTMDSPGCKLLLSGAEPIDERVARVHAADLGFSDHTDPRTAREALDGLIAQQADEKYLIITTDGHFDVGNGLQDVEAIVSEAAAQGVNVIYLGMGDEADSIVGSAERGIFVYAASNEGILQTMTEVANLVFGRAALPANAYDPAAQKLRLDVPMGQIIVFAQGPEVTASALSLPDGSAIEPSVTAVKYSEAPTAQRSIPDVLFNPNLQGIVAVYDGKLSKGDYGLSVAGAESIEVYYQPRVGIIVELADGANRYELSPGESPTVAAGAYRVSHYLVDPDTGDALDSDLLTESSFSLRAEGSAGSGVVGEGEDLILERGEVSLDAVATFGGGDRAHQLYRDLTVTPPVGLLSVETDEVPDRQAVARFSEPSRVRVTHQGGEPLSEEEWAQTSLSVGADKGPEWEVTRTDEVGVFEVKPVSEGAEALSGELFGPVALNSTDLTCDYVAEVHDGTYPLFRGTAEQEITVEPNLLATFLRWLWLLILLALLIVFVAMEVLKPRLPKINPRIVLDDGETLKLSPPRKIRHRVWPPWAPERTTFMLRVNGDPNDDYELRRRFAIACRPIGLKAVKRSKGRRRFVIDDETLELMKNTVSADGYPDPEYSCLRANSFGRGGQISIQGNQKHRRRGWVPQIDYLIKF